MAGLDVLDAAARQEFEQPPHFRAHKQAAAVAKVNPPCMHAVCLVFNQHSLAIGKMEVADHRIGPICADDARPQGVAPGLTHLHDGQTGVLVEQGHARAYLAGLYLEKG